MWQHLFYMNVCNSKLIAEQPSSPGEKIYVKTSFIIPLGEPKEEPKNKNMSM
jgi:hypothetical protein